MNVRIGSVQNGDVPMAQASRYKQFAQTQDRGSLNPCITDLQRIDKVLVLQVRQISKGILVHMDILDAIFSSRSSSVRPHLCPVSRVFERVIDMSASLTGRESSFGVPFVEVDEVVGLKNDDDEHDAEDREVACIVSEVDHVTEDSPMRPVWNTGSSDSR
jgi:hypothetical protein